MKQNFSEIPANREVDADPKQNTALFCLMVYLTPARTIKIDLWFRLAMNYHY